MSYIFLLHANADEAIAREIASALGASQHTTWDESHILVGDSILEAETRALLSADYVVLCLSKQAVESGWVERALSLAMLHQLQQRKTRVLPVRVEEVEPPALIEHLKHVDLFPNGNGYKHGVQRLVRSIAEHEKRASLRPPPLSSTSPGTSAAPAAPNNLPHRRVFVGREREFEELDRMLESAPGMAAESHRAALYGLGGAGKTALALEYAHRSLERGAYPGGVFWLGAEGKPRDRLLQLADDLRAVGPAAVRSALASRRAPAEKLVHSMRLVLQNHGEPVLLVLDNADEEGWNDELPAGATRVLMTTRDERLAFRSRLRIGILSDSEAIELARSVAGDPQTAHDEKALERVVLEELGGLAVAVEMAALAVSGWAGSWSNYEKGLRVQARGRSAKPAAASDLGLKGTCSKQQRPLLEDREPHSSYPRSVVAALDLSIDRCSPGSAKRRLLEGAATLAPEGMPIDWAAEAAELDPEDVAAQKALQELAGLGLLTVSDDRRGVSMHRLVYLQVRERAEGPSWIEASRRSAACVARWLVETVEPGRMEEVELRRPHIEEARWAAERAESDADWIDITDRLAMHLHHRALFSDALLLFEQVLRRAELLDPPDPGRTATCLVNQAMALKELERGAEALPLLEQSIAITEAAHGPSHRRLVARLSNLAMVRKDLGQAAAARLLLERALAIAECEYGPEHPKVAVSLSNLALVLQDLGHRVAARLLLERALSVNKLAYGDDHHEVATTLSNFALVLQDSGHTSDAVPMLRSALAIDEKTYGWDHPKVATTLSNLAGALRELGEVEEARALLVRALTIDEKAYGAVNTKVIGRLLALASKLQRAGSDLVEQIVTTMLSGASGPERSGALTRISELAKTAVKDAELEEERAERETRAERAKVETEQAKLGMQRGPMKRPDKNQPSGGPLSLRSPQTAYNPSTLARMYAGQRDRAVEQYAGQRDRAVEQIVSSLLQDALAVAQASYAPSHPAATSYLADIAFLRQDITPAEKIVELKRAMVLEERVYGLASPEVLKRLVDLASLLCSNNSPKVSAVVNRARAIADEFRGRDPAKALEQLDRLAYLTRDYEQEDWWLAIREQAFVIAEQLYGPESLDVVERLYDVVKRVEKLGRIEEALALRKRALAIQERLTGRESDEAFSQRNNIALHLARLHRAEELYALLAEQANRIAKSSPAPERDQIHNDLEYLFTLHPLRDLVALLNKMEHLIDPSRLEERTLALAGDIHGINSIEFVKSLDVMAACLHGMQRGSEGLRPLQERALALTEELQGCDSLNAFGRRNQLLKLIVSSDRKDEIVVRFAAQILMLGEQIHRYEAAESVRSVEPRQDEPSSYPSVQRSTRVDPSQKILSGNVLVQLRDAAAFLGNLEQSTPFASRHRVLAYAEATYRSDSIELLRYFDGVALVLHAQSCHSELISIQKRALSIAETIHGPESPEVCTRLRHVAALLRDQSMDDEGLRLHHRILTLEETIHGPESCQVLTSIEHMVALLDEGGVDQDLERLLNKGLALIDKFYGRYSFKALWWRDKLILTMIHLDRHDDISAIIEERTQIALKILDGENAIGAAMSIRYLDQLVPVLSSLGHRNQIRSLMDVAVESAKKLHPPDSPELTERLTELAAIQRTLERTR